MTIHTWCDISSLSDFIDKQNLDTMTRFDCGSVHAKGFAIYNKILVARFCVIHNCTSDPCHQFFRIEMQKFRLT